MGFIMQMKNKLPLDRLKKISPEKQLIRSRTFERAEICFQIEESPSSITIF